MYANNFSSFLWLEAFLVLISKDILNFMAASKSFTRQETLPIRMMRKILSAIFRAWRRGARVFIDRLLSTSLLPSSVQDFEWSLDLGLKDRSRKNKSRTKLQRIIKFMILRTQTLNFSCKIHDSSKRDLIGFKTVLKNFDSRGFKDLSENVPCLSGFNAQMHFSFVTSW